MLLPENSATIENLVQTGRPATVYRDRPEEWLSRTGEDEQRILDEVRAELCSPCPVAKGSWA